MASFNKVIIVGNLGQDPEIRHLPNGDSVTTVSIATSESWKDKATGEKKERVEWWKVTFWGKLAEIAGEYLKKGSSVLVEGRGKTETWEKDGVKHYRFTVVGDQMRMLGSKPTDHEDRAPAEQRATPGPKPSQAAPKASGKLDDIDDDVPF